MYNRFSLMFLSLIFSATTLAPLEASLEVRAFDTPNDDGSKGITIQWNSDKQSQITEYQIDRRKNGDEKFEKISSIATDKTKYIDRSAEIGIEYSYIVRAIGESANLGSMETPEVKAVGNWFHSGKSPLLLATLFFGGIMLIFIRLSGSGRSMFIRKIAALDAVESAVGRATEMGRPILFVPGMNSISDPATIAAVSIFEAVATLAVKDRTRLRVPCRDPIVESIIRSSLNEVYQAHGQLDQFRADDVHFVSEEQFAYVAAVDGIIEREKPATIFLQGYFYAESLILAEVGNSIGAIQIAGTSSDAQLPFFITACDHTLIGEELYAAGAYMKNDARQIGTLKAQDLIKVILFGLLFIGVIMAQFDNKLLLDFFSKKW